MRISEIKSKIEQGDCSEETLDLFKTALKRVPKNGRCQHCYTTAASMPSRFHKQAISLIQYGLTQHCNDWIDRMRAHANIALILENNKDYYGAKQSYFEAISSVDANNRSNYESEYVAHMMRMEMHISNFEYTDDLEKFYNIAIQADEFSQAFQTFRFFRLLAEIIIFRKRDDLSSAKQAFMSANEMLQPGFVGSLTRLLKRKGFIETTGATKEALKFLRRVKRIF